MFWSGFLEIFSNSCFRRFGKRARWIWRGSQINQLWTQLWDLKKPLCGKNTDSWQPARLFLLTGVPVQASVPVWSKTSLNAEEYNKWQEPCGSSHWFPWISKKRRISRNGYVTCACRHSFSLCSYVAAAIHINGKFQYHGSLSMKKRQMCMTWASS